MTQTILVPNTVFTVSNLLSPAECDDYIAETEKIGYQPAPITTSAGFEMRPDIRNNRRVMLDDIERSTVLWERIEPHIPPVLQLQKQEAIGLNERLRFYRYDPGEYFAPHFDGAYRRPNGEISIWTFMVYLNEGFVGGETRFNSRYPHSDVTVVPQKGMALCFIHHLLHEGAPVIQGRKYVLRSDVMYSAPE